MYSPIRFLKLYWYDKDSGCETASSGTETEWVTDNHETQ